MPDRYRSQLPYEGEMPGQDAIWDALAEQPLEEPAATVRRRFHRELNRAEQLSFVARLRDLFGFSGKLGWATAAACLIVGLFAGRAIDGSNGQDRLAALEDNVEALNRNLILDRINNAEPGKRLQGIMDAAYLVQDDPQITAALLERASDDRLASIRSAAIDALAPRMSTPDVGRQLMTLLANAESPLVQFALVDLVLRYGDEAQLDELHELASTDRLHPELVRYIDQSLGRESNET